MSVRLRIAEVHTPAFLRKKKICELFRLTARAFDMEAPLDPGAEGRDTIRAYAIFSRVNAERTLNSGGDVDTLKRRLYDRAYEFGSGLRRILRVSKPEDVMRAARLLYRFINIDFRGRPDGEVVVRKCYFSDYYSAPVCALMSSLDEGVLAGLAGGGRLVFTERITEGKNRCLAAFTFPEAAR